MSSWARDNVTCDFVSDSPAVPNMYCLSYKDGLNPAASRIYQSITLHFCIAHLAFFFSDFSFESERHKHTAATDTATAFIYKEKDMVQLNTNQTRGTLLEKQGRAHKRCTPVDLHIWMCKSRTTSTNLHTATMWGHRM